MLKSKLKVILAVVFSLVISIGSVSIFFAQTQANDSFEDNVKWQTGVDVTKKYNNKESFIVIATRTGDQYESRTSDIFLSWMNEYNQTLYAVKDIIPDFAWDAIDEETNNGEVLSPVVLFVKNVNGKETVTAVTGCDDVHKHEKLNKAFENYMGITAVPVTVKPVSIEVLTLPDKTLYDMGEKFDSTGLVLKAIYDNGRTEKIYSEYTVKNFDSSKEGKTVVTVEYKGKTVSFDILISNVQTYKINVKYNQNEAREMADMVNKLRDKKYVMTYDYELEKAAMQRAAELVVFYSHNRPNGKKNSSVLNGKSFIKIGENIAVGYETAEEAFAAFRDSKGHYDNMVDSVYTGAAYGCAEYNGLKYWVQLFSNPVFSSEETTPVNSTQSVQVDILDTYVDVADIQIATNKVIIKDGKPVNLPEAYAIINVMAEDFDKEIDTAILTTAKISAVNNWGSCNTDIVNIENKKIVPKTNGSTEIYVNFGNETKTIPVTAENVTPSGSTTKAENSSTSTPSLSETTSTTKTTTSTPSQQQLLNLSQQTRLQLNRRQVNPTLYLLPLQIKK